MKLRIAGKNITFFDEISLTRSLDSIGSSFAFKTRFNPENDEHKELFKPLQFLKTEIFDDNDKLLFTGLIVNHSFESNKDINLLSISGYSLSGLLEDVCVPVDQYPLESLNRSIKDIAGRLCGLFGIGLIIDGSAANECNQVFETTTTSPTETIKGYLAKLTSQKNVVLSHNEKGQVVIFKPNVNAHPDYYFNKGNTLSMSSSWNGQSMHSHIFCVRQPSDENEGVATSDSITNPLIQSYRPVVKVLTSGEDTDTSKAADNELASELKGISVKVRLLGLFEDIKPGDIVNIHNHEIYSFAYSRWMVSKISLSVNIKESITELDLVLPETFTGSQPKDILFYNKSHKRDI